MKHCYSVPLLVFTLIFSIQAHGTPEKFTTERTFRLPLITASDSLLGSKDTPLKPNTKITPIVAKNTGGNLQGETTPATPEIFAPMNSRLRGYREMIRGFREMEQDETLAYSQNNSEPEIKLQAYPNPASHVLKINMGNTVEVDKIEIYDASGTLKDTYSDPNPWQREIIEINTVNLCSGSYTLRVYAKGIPFKPIRIVISR